MIAYFEQHKDLLDADAQRRLHSNPLRILDSKNPAMQELIAGAPRLMDELEDEALQHFAAVQDILKRHEVPFEINTRLDTHWEIVDLMLDAGFGYSQEQVDLAVAEPPPFEARLFKIDDKKADLSNQAETDAVVAGLEPCGDGLGHGHPLQAAEAVHLVDPSLLRLVVRRQH